MKRTTALKILNPILGILFVNQMLSALLHDVMSHEVFEILHEGAGYALIGAVVLHVILNWNWIKANFLKKAKAK